MEQPPPLLSPPPFNQNNMNTKQNKKSKRMPSPQELVSHYEKKGMETQEASLKVINDLQGALFRMVAATRGPKSDPGDVTSAKLDAIHARLLQIEMKVDSKPGYPQAMGIGIASAGAWSAVCQIWDAVKRVTSPPNHSLSKKEEFEEPTERLSLLHWLSSKDD